MIFIATPGAILTGLTLSPAMNAASPWLLAVFGGRQSARSIHFLCAMALALFILVHVAMVLLAGAGERAPVDDHRALSPASGGRIGCRSIAAG